MITKNQIDFEKKLIAYIAKKIPIESKTVVVKQGEWRHVVVKYKLEKGYQLSLAIVNGVAELAITDPSEEFYTELELNGPHDDGIYEIFDFQDVDRVINAYFDYFQKK
ncbi:hypothetical protein [Pseudolactococcus insecticola]|uniref:Uncharacterized protein n=1 Tax=Pseudolactococcus insecticola TaxID=2709158 RepID=A0A6A0B9X7_9LACT|nr:hypothetical protein [Lactococcus insecticola]GFH41423.1 hypothetical protein Hs20B_18210 [Lactococcus insecticola]